MKSYQFPADFVPSEEGGFVVTFSDMPEAITQGESIEDCTLQATDALDKAIMGRINTNLDLPVSSRVEQGQYLIQYRHRLRLKLLCMKFDGCSILVFGPSCPVLLKSWSELESALWLALKTKMRFYKRPHVSSAISDSIWRRLTISSLGNTSTSGNEAAEN